MKGRPPKPTEQKLREGNPGKRKLAAPVVVGGRSRPEAPKGLDRDTRRVWDQLVQDMEGSGVLDRADGPTVEGAAVGLALARQLRRERVEARKLVTAAEKKLKAASGPDDELDCLKVVEAHEARWLRLYRAEKDAWAEARQHFDRLGIGPVGRARLGMAGGQGKSPGRDMDERVGESPRARRAALRAVEGGSS